MEAKEAEKTYIVYLAHPESLSVRLANNRQFSATQNVDLDQSMHGPTHISDQPPLKIPSATLVEGDRTLFFFLPQTHEPLSKNEFLNREILQRGIEDEMGVGIGCFQLEMLIYRARLERKLETGGFRDGGWWVWG